MSTDYGYAPSPAADPFEENAVVRTLRLLRSHKLVIVASILVAVAAATTLSLAQSKKYASTATLLFSDPTQALISPQAPNVVVDPQRTSATNRQLVALGIVAADTSRRLHGIVSASQVSGAISVDSVGQTDLLRITATTSSAGRSAPLANAYANSYMSLQAQAAQQQIDTAIARIRGQLAGATGAGRQQLASRLNDLVVARSVTTSGARIVQPAATPTSAVSRHLVRNLLLSVLIGLIIGILIAVLRDRLSAKIKTADEAEHVFGVPVLATVPRNRYLLGKQVGPGMLTGAEAEPFRALRASLRYAGLPDDRRSIMVASPAVGDGKSTVARQLAAVMAATGDSVVLVEADLNHRAGPRIFGRASRTNGSSEPGLTQLVTSDEPLDEQNLRQALSFVRLDHNGHGGPERWLAVLPSGPPAAHPAELLESDQMRDVMEWLQDHFNTVIVDTPALGVVSDAMSVLSYCSGVVVVAGVGQTTRDDAYELARRLELGNAKVIGVVVNFVPPESTSYSYTKRPAGLLTRFSG
jgi:polysaccharide biosynthesis transport protein